MKRDQARLDDPPQLGAPDGTLTREGVNCWRRPLARRASVLVDGQYFAALADALERAQRSVLILGWDFHDETVLEPEGGSGRTIGALLRRVLRQHPGLHVHILDWDFSVVFATERQLFPPFRRWWRTPARLHFRYDASCPAGGSHHQKIVVIDDAVAFCGGFDVTARRWDSREHLADDPRRTDPWGAKYEPFHDVQMMVDDEAAAALGALARKRWHRATGEALRVVPPGERGDPWPRSVPVRFRDVPVAIARSEPCFEDDPGVREVEQLYLDGIAAARDVLYLENQYLSSRAIADALASRLSSADGPEIVLIGPSVLAGWFEERVMGATRSRVLARLSELPGAARLGAFAPVTGADAKPIMVHSKVMIVDDRLLRVGSSNLCNRSMGLDTECDLAVEATDVDARRRVLEVRDDLLAEHLGVPVAEVSASVQRHGSVLQAIRSLAGRSSSHTLVSIEPGDTTVLDTVVGATTPFDAEQPVDPEHLLVTMGVERTAARASWRLIAGAALVTLLALAWRFGPLGAWLDPRKLVAAGGWLGQAQAGPLIAFGIVVAGSVAMVPLTVLVVAAALVFGPVMGFAVALGGAVTGAVVSYGIGAQLWRGAVQRVAGRRLGAITRRLQQRGVAAMAFMRLIPLAPFGVVNLVAGSAHLGLRAFALGTLIGLAPGMLAMVTLADRVAAGQVTGAVLVLVFGLVGVAGLAKVLRRVAD